MINQAYNEIEMFSRLESGRIRAYNNLILQSTIAKLKRRNVAEFGA